MLHLCNTFAASLLHHLHCGILSVFDIVAFFPVTFCPHTSETIPTLLDKSRLTSIYFATFEKKREVRSPQPTQSKFLVFGKYRICDAKTFIIFAIPVDNLRSKLVDCTCPSRDTWLIIIHTLR